MPKLILPILLAVFLFLSPAESEAVALTTNANIYPIMSDIEKAVIRSLTMDAIGYARPSIQSTILGQLYKNQSGYILRRAFGYLGPVAVAATLAMSVYDIYNFAKSSDENKAYFDGKIDPLEDVSQLTQAPVPGGKYDWQGYPIKITKVTLLNNNYQSTSHPATTTSGYDLLVYVGPNGPGSYGGEFKVYDQYRIQYYVSVPPVAPNMLDGGTKESFEAELQTAIDAQGSSDSPYPRALNGIDKAMDAGAPFGQVSATPSPYDVKDLADRVAAEQAQNAATNAQTQAQTAAQDAVATAQTAVQAAQAKYDELKNISDADPASSDKLKAAQDALADLNKAKNDHSTAIATAGKTEAEIAQEKADALAEAAAAASAADKVKGSSEYDGTFDLPDKKSIVELITSVVSMSPIVQMVKSFTITTSGGVSFVSAGNVYGQELVFNFLRYEQTFNQLGGVLLVVCQGFAVLIVIRGW
jgi:hypothetical protein